MGFTPQDVNRMSMWQFFAALNGFVEAKTPKENKKLSAAEADDLFNWLESEQIASRLTTQTYLWDEYGPVYAGKVTFDI